MKFCYNYFLNAVFYQMWLNEKCIDKLLKRIIEIWFNIPFKLIYKFLCRYIFTNKFKIKYDNWRAAEEYKLKSVMHNPEDGISIASTKYLFGYFYSSYPSILTLIIGSKVLKSYGESHMLLALSLAAIPIAVAYIPAYNAIFSKDRYLKYFKEFEIEDKQWHKKWKKITWLFIIGAILSLITGIAAMWIVFLYF